MGERERGWGKWDGGRNGALQNVTDLPPSTIATGNGGALPRRWLIVAHMLLRPSVGIRGMS